MNLILPSTKEVKVSGACTWLNLKGTREEGIKEEINQSVTFDRQLLWLLPLPLAR